MEIVHKIIVGIQIAVDERHTAGSCLLYTSETDIDAKADEPIRPLNLMGAHILCQKQLAAVLEIERLTGGVQLCQSCLLYTSGLCLSFS